MNSAAAPKSLSLIHLINGRSANVGNGALTDGAEALLSEDLNHRVNWQRDCWDDYTFGERAFDASFVESINLSDGMIVGGAVALNGRSFYGNTGMRFNLPLELWPEIMKPLVFYGLSYRVWPGQVYEHLDQLRRTFEYILSHDKMLLALRNDGTKQWLAREFGIEDDRLFVVPDPGVFAVADPSGPYPEFQPGRPNIIVALNDEDREGRFVTTGRRESVLKGVAAALEKLVTHYHANIILVPHYFDDYRAIADVIDFCKPVIAHQNIIGTGLARIEGSRQFYGRYLHADAVISMRVHSMSPCIGLGVPMVPLVSQGRMTDFLDGLGLDDLAVDAFAPDMTDRLVQAVVWTMQHQSEVRTRYLQARNTMREEARTFNAMVSGLLDAC